MPSRFASTPAMAGTAGVRSATTRHRDRMVIGTSSWWSDGAQSRNTVRGGGSSTALSSALAAPSVNRSASVTIRIWYGAVAGRREASWTRLRISPTPIESPSGTTSRTSEWVLFIVVWQTVQCPQPWSGHCNAAAKARAATERPLPGGPVNSQAWVIAVASSAAPRSTATASGWPTTSSHTVTA
jgi:adenylate cyclase